MTHANLVRSIVVSATIIAGSSASLAGECRYGSCFGALGAGERGYAVKIQNLDTAQTASEELATICRGKCTTMEVFNDGCGVIVQGGRSELFAGFGASHEDARSEAETFCALDGHSRCVMRAMVCTR